VVRVNAGGNAPRHPSVGDVTGSLVTSWAHPFQKSFRQMDGKIFLAVDRYTKNREGRRYIVKLGGVPQSSRPGFLESSGNTPHKVGEEKCEESKAKTANFGKD